MLQKRGVAVPLSILIVSAMGSVARAEEEGSGSDQPSDIPISVKALKLKLKADYRVELEYNDNANNVSEVPDATDPEKGSGTFVQGDESDAISSTAIGLTGFRLNLRGELDSATSFRVRYNLTKSDLEYGYLKREFGPVYFLLGNNKVKQFGHRNIRSGLVKHYKALFNSAGGRPFSSYQPVIELGSKIMSFGSVALQLTNDKSSIQQPEVAIEYKGNFGGFKPLLQYSMFDIARSNHIAVGLGYEGLGIDLAVDYNLTTRYVSKNSKTIQTGIVVDASYTVEGIVTPFVSFSNLATTNEADGDSEEVTVNKQLVPDAAGNQIVAGLEYPGFSSAIIPFLAYELVTGKYMVSKGEEEAKETELAVNTIKLGVFGHF